MSRIVNIKYSYIAVLTIFTIPFLSSLFIPTPYIQLLSSPICLIVTGYLLRDELLEQVKLFEKHYLSKILNILLILMGSQLILDYISSVVLTQPHSFESPNIPIYFIFIVSSAPILEEIIFRHIIYRTLQGNKQGFSILAATISSLIFAAMHMSTIGFLGYFAIGMIFCYYYYSTKNIYTTIIAHMVFNFLYVFVASIHMVFGGNQ